MIMGRGEPSPSSDRRFIARLYGVDAGVVIQGVAVVGRPLGVTISRSTRS
jgi:hypothetical protein